jgi:hypothetical protein
MKFNALLFWIEKFTYFLRIPKNWLLCIPCVRAVVCACVCVHACERTRAIEIFLCDIWRQRPNIILIFIGQFTGYYSFREILLQWL